jgi:hypothetical protein
MGVQNRVKRIRESFWERDLKLYIRVQDNSVTRLGEEWWRG